MSRVPSGSRAEVRWLLGRRRRADQAGGGAHRRHPAGRARRGRRGLRDGGLHRRAARPRPAGDAAAARPGAGHAAHRRRADQHGAAGDGDPHRRRGRAVVHRLAGRRDHRQRARPGPDHRRHPGPHPGGAGRRRGGHRRRLPGRLPGHQGRHHARRGGTDTTPSRSRGRSRDVCESTRRDGVSPPTRGSCRGPAAGADQYEEMLEWPPPARRAAPAVGEYARRYGIAVGCVVFSHCRGPGRRLDRRSGHGAGDHHRRRADRAKPSPVVGVPDKPGRRGAFRPSPTRRSHRHDRADVSVARRPDGHPFTLPKPTAGPAWDAQKGGPVASIAAVRRPRRQGLAGRRGMRSHPGVSALLRALADAGSTSADLASRSGSRCGRDTDLDPRSVGARRFELGGAEAATVYAGTGR